MFTAETTDRLCHDDALDQFASTAAQQIACDWAHRFGYELTDDQIEELNLVVWETLWEPQDRVS